MEAKERPSPKVLRRLYEFDRLTMSQVGSRFGVTAQTISCWLVGAGISRRSSGESKTKRNKPSAKALYSLYVIQGLSLREIAERAEVGITTISRWLKSAGIDIRSPSEAIKLSFKKGRLPNVPTLDQCRKNSVSLKKWMQQNPEALQEIRRKGARVTAHRRGITSRWVGCAWCGKRIKRKKHQLEQTTYSSCCYSHTTLYQKSRKTPIVDRMGQYTTTDLMSVKELPPVPAVTLVQSKTGDLKLVSVEKKKRGKRAICAEVVGPIGEALLAAQKNK